MKTLKHLTKTELFSNPGDSGGIVYTYYDNKNIPCGIIHGHSAGALTDYSYYVKASEIVNALGAEPY